MRSKLGRAYAQGKAQWARAQRGSGGGYGGYRSPLTDGLERSICDNISGMTDRYLALQHRQLLVPV